MEQSGTADKEAKQEDTNDMEADASGDEKLAKDAGGASDAAATDNEDQQQESQGVPPEENDPPGSPKMKPDKLAHQQADKPGDEDANDEATEDSPLAKAETGKLKNTTSDVENVEEDKKSELEEQAEEDNATADQKKPIATPTKDMSSETNPKRTYGQRNVNLARAGRRKPASKEDNDDQTSGSAKVRETTNDRKSTNNETDVATEVKASGSNGSDPSGSGQSSVAAEDKDKNDSKEVGKAEDSGSKVNASDGSAGTDPSSSKLTNGSSTSDSLDSNKGQSNSSEETAEDSTNAVISSTGQDIDGKKPAKEGKMNGTGTSGDELDQKEGNSTDAKVNGKQSLASQNVSLVGTGQADKKEELQSVHNKSEEESSSKNRSSSDAAQQQGNGTETGTQQPTAQEGSQVRISPLQQPPTVVDSKSKLNADVGTANATDEQTLGNKTESEENLKTKTQKAQEKLENKTESVGKVLDGSKSNIAKDGSLVLSPVQGNPGTGSGAADDAANVTNTAQPDEVKKAELEPTDPESSTDQADGTGQGENRRTRSVFRIGNPRARGTETEDVEANRTLYKRLRRTGQSQRMRGHRASDEARGSGNQVRELRSRQKLGDYVEQEPQNNVQRQLSRPVNKEDESDGEENLVYDDQDQLVDTREQDPANNDDPGMPGDDGQQDDQSYDFNMLKAPQRFQRSA